MRKALVCTLAMCCITQTWAQSTQNELGRQEPSDSVCAQRETHFARTLDHITSSRAFRMTYIGVPLIAGGLIMKNEDTKFRKLRNDYMPQFRRHLDDNLQFVPAVVMLGLKVGGVDSRSSWGRMIVSDGFSALVMGGLVNTLKHSTKVMRPDGSNSHSFPSGHTATAFMTATMLNKEYGHKNPWIGIGAYSVATATGLMRMANNKHWLSDVLTGAGIGILSTELGYYLADLIFKDKGINKHDQTFQSDRHYSPTFVSLYLGMNIPLSSYDIDEHTEYRTSSGSSAGAEGAFFFNPYIGVGGRFTVSTTSIIVNDTDAADNTADAAAVCGGPYFSYPISSRWLVGSKLLLGRVHYNKLELTEKTIPSRDGIFFGSGLSLSYRANECSGVRFFLDYNLLPSHSKQSGEHINTLTIGSSFMVTF